MIFLVTLETGLRNGCLSRGRVVINSVSSKRLKAKNGVPQGLVLGPIFFLIYAYDMDDGITCKISKFTDGKMIALK